MTATEVLRPPATAPRLPEGWRWVRLGDVARLLPSRSIASDGDADVQTVTTACLTELGFDATGLKPARMRGTDVADCTLAAGEVLIARSNTPELVGRASLFEGEPAGAVASDLTIRVRTAGDLMPDFLARYLSALFVGHYWRERAGGASGSMKKITRTQVADLVVPLPSMEEQQRIAAVLREQMAAVEKARAAAQARLDAAMTLPKAIIQEALRNAPTCRHKLAACLIEVKAGVGEDWANYPVLGATRDGLSPAKEGVGKMPERYKLVDPVTVFYNPMRILLGSIALVDDTDQAGITSPDYVVVKGRPGVLDTRWFYHWFRSSHGAQLIDSLSRGAVRERILFNRLATGEIELPDYDTQLRASERMKQVRPVVEAITEELEAIDALPSAILREAFAGVAP